jgi:hypothetical protein
MLRPNSQSLNQFSYSAASERNVVSYQLIINQLS